MARRARSLLLALVTAFAAAGAPAASAAALPCDAPYVDAAERVGGPDRPLIDERIAQLEGHGAVVRVRLLPTLDDTASVDAWIARETARCPSWQDPDGSRNANLVALVISFDPRQASVTWGEAWDETYRLSADVIRTSVLTPLLRSGDVGAAVSTTVASLAAVAGGRITINPPKAAAPPPRRREEPGPSTWAILGLLAVIGGIIVGAISLVSSLAGRGGGWGGGGSGRRWSSWSSGSGSDHSWSSGSSSSGDSGWSGGSSSGGDSGGGGSSGGDGGSSSGSW